MINTLGIRREDKNIWEKRVPIIPDHVKELKENMSIFHAVSISWHKPCHVVQLSKTQWSYQRDYHKSNIHIEGYTDILHKSQR